MPTEVLRSTKDNENAQFDTKTHESTKRMHGDLCRARARGIGVQFSEGFLRVSKVTGAELYASQLLQAGKHRDVRALVRLPLLPPLAISAAVAHSVTGNDKGIW